MKCPRFYLELLSSFKKIFGIFRHVFVAFSENMNFTNGQVHESNGFFGRSIGPNTEHRIIASCEILFLWMNAYI